MTVSVTLTCELATESLDALQHFLAANLSNVRGFEGGQRVSILFDQNNQNMLIDEDWQSVSAHKSYMQFIEQNGVLAELASFFKRPPTINYYFPTNL
ncbi:antibiotic biosynthesis monooxygenase [Catenovulum sp. SM1970]|uniref:antibiotic biosynthesis monooxygenase n=1 Tax=Marinifaba aquimaris TaxID=2741323 RepID=UPI001574C99E|nr:antibiotic biosynthesis monooxygenase [Marinifaba aquimaris]NTS75796.1 antibiotic biosynthesis monooxygenase [Marinifaba aquimaris]